MKKTFVIAAAVLVSTVVALAEAPEWKMVPEILARIVPPKFPAREFDITKFGAVGDGKTDCTAAIAKAIAACVKKGGGCVVVPAGDFLTGPIHLLSNVDLHLAATNSVLKFSTDPKKYLPAVLTRFEGMECYNYSPLIYAFGQKNVAVTGQGTLDGQAEESNWLAWKGQKNLTNGTQKIARKRLDDMNNNGVPVSQRVFGEGDFLRPPFVEFNLCRNVLIEGVKVRRSPKTRWLTGTPSLFILSRRARAAFCVPSPVVLPPFHFSPVVSSAWPSSVPCPVTATFFCPNA